VKNVTRKLNYVLFIYRPTMTVC